MKARVSGIVFRLLLFGFALLVLNCAVALVSSSNAEATAKIQVCLVIDGSGTIDSNEWNLIIQAVAKGINDTIPHDGSIELTVVQFGGSIEASARTEIAPTAIDASDFATVSAQVLAIPKIGGGTPTANGLFLGWNELKSSPRFATAQRQVINLATDDLPNVRNYNATSDLDGSGGNATASDDVVAVVNEAVNQGLDELDVEGIALPDESRDWFKNWVVHPQPGAIAPPFSKPGWIRIVADVPEFANTLGEKLHVIISGGEIWVPPADGALAAGLITIGLVSLVSALSSAINNPETFPSSVIAQKVNTVFPDTLKKWLADFISSKRKLIIGKRTGSPFILTKWEVVSYAVSLSVLTFAFSYAKAAGLNEILNVLPTVLATSIIVEFAKNFTIVVIARRMGVWTEHRLWYFGLATFLFSSLVFRVPFSSPSRITHNSPRFTKRSLGLVASSSVFIGLAFAGMFYALFVGGFTLIGNIGVIMSLTMAFFETVPIPPMSGKDIYNWSRFLWMTLFITTFALYMLCLFLL
jgi:hypothetical protein